MYGTYSLHCAVLRWRLACRIAVQQPTAWPIQQSAAWGLMQRLRSSHTAAGGALLHAAQLQTTAWSTIPSHAASAASTASTAEALAADAEVEDTLKVADLIRRFQSRGHLVAQLDPLRRTRGGPWLGPVGDEYHRSDPLLLDLLEQFPSQGTPQEQATFLGRCLGLSGPVTAERTFRVGSLMPDGAAPAAGGAASSAYSHRLRWTLPEVFTAMRESYCGTLAVEYVHLHQQREQDWMRSRVEGRTPLPDSERRALLRRLLAADALERFLSEKYPATKRFGLEGCEALVPGLHAMMEACAGHGVQRIEVAMAHRGRLNLLVNLLDKRIGALCSKMNDQQSELRVGDVKYHLGQSATYIVEGHASSSSPPPGQQQQQQQPPREVRLSIAPNPSHLEAVAPVVLGMVRAQQDLLDRGSTSSGSSSGSGRGQQRVLALLVHGDAALAGLGCVSEVLQLAEVPGFSVGGAIHCVINNQVGFTTMPRHGRSSAHPTDGARALGTPVLHVNADDPEAVVHAFKIAAEWRARWLKDVVVDVVGYRRNGHNELDDPTTTLPLSYARIAHHPAVLDIYAAKLQAEGVVTCEEVAAWAADVRASCEAEWEAAARGKFKESAQQFLGSSWQGDALAALSQEGAHSAPPQQEPTGLPLATLQRVGQAICNPPPGFAPHPDVTALLQARKAMVEGAESRVGWAMAEALAFGTLMLHRETPPSTNGNSNASRPLGMGLNRGHYDVRLTGQDVERGTFNQRHAVLWDQQTGERCVLLNSVKPGRQDTLDVWNSTLSEAAVLGFEYGYSLGARDDALVAWEAQYGDFASNAQVVIDEFIAAGEEKWGQQSGLVLLLPHGYDGQGPDHSSGRMERFLQLCAEDPDALPGQAPAQRRLIRDTFEAVARNYGGKLHREQALELLRSLGITQVWSGGGGAAAADRPNRSAATELAELLWVEMGLPEGAPITWRAWERFMVQYLRRNAERDAPMFVVNATTPAQLFHVLRRQVNLPFKKPLVLFTPKYLLHHRPCTSALQDLTSGTFFNRVIDDGKASDNTRHLSRHPRTGQPFLAPPGQVRRVILCTGQVYYALSRARRARRIRDVVLVRLEQISPFPHDLLSRVVGQYTCAELVWVQEEPKNMGAWSYVQPRLLQVLRHLPQMGGAAGAGEFDVAAASSGSVEGGNGTAVGGAASVRYIGRAPSASPATASFAIHVKETQDIVNAALS